MEATFKNETIHIYFRNKKNNKEFYNEFGVEDIGKTNSIHPKVELQEIWQSLVAGSLPSSTNPKTDTGIFGEIISNIGSIPCFKVESTGRIIVFTVLKNELTGVSKTYRSILNLNENEGNRKDLAEESKKERKQEIRQVKMLEKHGELQDEEEEEEKDNQNKGKAKSEYLEEVLKANYQICKDVEEPVKSAVENNFDFDGVRLRYIGENGVPSMFAFEKLLVRKGSRQYRIKIIQNKEKSIKIGVLNLSVARCYKVLCTFETIKGKRFLENQTVSISLNNSKNLAQLFFEKNPTAIESRFWKDGTVIQKSTVFVEMSNVGDTIYLLQ